MAEADIPAQEPLSKKSVPSYEEQLAAVESQMTCYDTPLTQAAGYLRDLLKTIIVLQKREIPMIEHERCRTQAYVGRVAQVKDYVERLMPPDVKEDAILRFNGWITIADARRLIGEPKLESGEGES